MRRSGILHPELSLHLARLGHTDSFVIGDCGLPIPPGVARVDLAVTFGVPGFAEVADAILAEIETDSAVIAEEAAGSAAGQVLAERFADAATVPHEDFKQLIQQARFAVRTGDTTPYSNVLVRCGVPF